MKPSAPPQKVLLRYPRFRVVVPDTSEGFKRVLLAPDLSLSAVLTHLSEKETCWALDSRTIASR